VASLAAFFPAACPLRIPVQVQRAGGNAAGAEDVVIQFGTAQEIFFASTLPLEFAEVVRVKNSDGSLDVEVQVVAMQEHEGQLAVAARFRGKVANWIVKP
jgi:hypothetical protein